MITGCFELVKSISSSSRTSSSKLGIFFLRLGISDKTVEFVSRRVTRKD